MTRQDTQGWLEVISGGMFSGKTSELIRRLHRAQRAKLNVALFKPHIDQRYHDTNVVSHSGTEMPATVVNSSLDLPKLCEGLQVIGIDEAQFFDSHLPDILQKLADSGIKIVVAGLELDSNRKPFGPMPTLLCLAERVTKLQAICASCGRDSAFSKRLVQSESTVCVGGPEAYEPLCRGCYIE